MTLLPGNGRTYSEPTKPMSSVNPAGNNTSVAAAGFDQCNEASNIAHRDNVGVRNPSEHGTQPTVQRHIQRATCGAWRLAPSGLNFWPSPVTPDRSTVPGALDQYSGKGRRLVAHFPAVFVVSAANNTV